MKVLNVGGGNKKIAIPAHYADWDHVLLDIQEGEGVDVVCNAVDMADKLEPKMYDSIYSSHNLEHHYRHNLPKLFDGFKHVLKDAGFVEIHVPNMQSVFEHCASGKDIEDIAYVSAAGPIRYVDMIYGLGSMIDENNGFMSHHNGFTAKSLGNLFFQVGFKYVYVGINHDAMSLIGFAFMQKPTDELMEILKLKDEIL
jgi:hypothetical protein